MSLPGANAVRDRRHVVRCSDESVQGKQASPIVPQYMT
jgi:hypothetical protein